MRSRPRIFALLLATVALGLASRQFPWLFPAVFGKYPGDALWAQMVYWLVALCAPTASISRVSAWALAIAYIDELSQLYQSAWINALRQTTLGHAVLGSHFAWRDVIAYTVGVVIVAAIDWMGWARIRARSQVS